MKLVQTVLIIASVTLFSNNSLAGVYKCTDNQGKTAYQAAPCVDTNEALKINVKTGGSKDLLVEKKKKELELEEESKLLESQNLEKQKIIDLEAKRIKDSAEQTALNQQLVRINILQFSAFAIPPYAADNLPPIVKQFESRLPDIEKFRRYAAQKALATGDCKRVESDELSLKSKLDNLIITVGCSTAKTFHYDETELVKK